MWVCSGAEMVPQKYAMLAPFDNLLILLLHSWACTSVSIDHNEVIHHFCLLPMLSWKEPPKFQQKALKVTSFLYLYDTYSVGCTRFLCQLSNFCSPSKPDNWWLSRYRETLASFFLLQTFSSSERSQSSQITISTFKNIAPFEIVAKKWQDKVASVRKDEHREQQWRFAYYKAAAELLRGLTLYV